MASERTNTVKARAGLDRPGPAWVTSELVADTIRTWEPFYGRKLTEGEARAILQAVGGLIDLLEHSS